MKCFRAIALAPLIILFAPAEARVHGGAAEPSIPTLVAGAGWTGITAQPASQGSSGDPQFTALTDAHFDDVQFQTITGSHNFGVWAWHNPTSTEVAAGKHYSLDHVSCSENNGPFSDVFTPSINPADSRLEFMFNIAASQTSDGEQEIRCIAYPTTGVPLVMQGPYLARIGSRSGVAMTASISGTTLTSSIGLFGSGLMSVSSLHILPNTFITASLGSNQYTVNQSQTVATENASAGDYQSLYINTNANGTLPATTEYVNNLTGNDTTGNGTSGNPYATTTKAINVIAAAQSNDVGGGTIYLQCPTNPTNYALLQGSSNFNAATQWVTVARAPGCAAGSVVITSTSGNRALAVAKLHLDNISFSTVITNTLTQTGAYGNSLWLSNFVGAGTSYNAQQITDPYGSYPGGVFCTDGEIGNMTEGCTAATLVRNMNVHDIANDAFSADKAVFNSSSSTQSPYQFAGAAGNTTIGSPCLTNVSSTTSFGVGFGIQPQTGSAFTLTSVTAIGDVVACGATNTVTVGVNATANATGITFKGGEHPDVYQQGAGANWLQNVALDGVTGTSNVNAQGVFGDSAGVRTYAILNSSFGSVPGGFITMQWEGSPIDILWADTTWAGTLLWNSGFSATNFQINGNVCPNNTNPGPATGVTYSGSSGC